MDLNLYKIIKSREDLYCWLSAVFYLPEKDLLGKDFRETAIQTFNNLKLEQLFGEIKKMENEINDKSINLLELKKDYSKLFLGPSSLLAPPYESFYRDQGQTMGDSTIDVISFYKKYNMELDSNFNDLPDHIAVELNFLSFLCTFEKKAFNQDDFSLVKKIRQAQLEFLENHLQKWIIPFTNRVKKYAELEYYKSAGEILKKSIEKDYQHLKSEDTRVEGKQ